MTAHRVSLLRSSLRRFPDPARSRDPHVRALVDQLSRLPVAAGPDARFRSELRTQLVAITPRMVTEGAEEIAHDAAVAAVATGTADEGVDEEPKRLRRAARPGAAPRIGFGRALKIATPTLTVLVLLLGGAVWLSRSALPGDALYGLKRASESVELSTASSDTGRANDYLRFAQNRTAEIGALLDRSHTDAFGSRPGAAGAHDAHTSSLIDQTLRSADADVRSAAKLLGRAAQQQHAGSPLQTMISWAPGQLARLTSIWTAMPLGQLRARAASSKSLVTAAAARAEALRGLVNCACMSGAGTDELGPVPCTNCTPTGQHVPTPGGTNGTSNRHGGSGSTVQHKGSRGTASTPSRASVPRRGSSGSPPAGKPTTPPTVSKQPNLPLPRIKPMLPKASVGSCGVSVSVIGVKVALGDCSPSSGYK